MNTSLHRPYRPRIRRAVQASLVSALLLTLAACSDSTPTARPAAATPALPPPADPALAAKGAKVYAEYCAQCHYDGAGNRGMPALRGSAVVTGAPAGLIQVLLKGQRGVSVVNGQKLNAYMPSLDYLDDGELAAVVMHVRRKFAGLDEKVTAAEVKASR